MTTMFFLVAALLLGGIAGFVAGFFVARIPESPTETDTDKDFRLRRQIQELSAELEKTTKERADDLTIASQIPIIVKRLGGRLAPGSCPVSSPPWSGEERHTARWCSSGPPSPSEGNGRTPRCWLT